MWFVLRSLPQQKVASLILVDWHQQNVPSTAFTCEHFLRVVPSPRHHRAHRFQLFSQSAAHKNPLGLDFGLASSDCLSRPNRQLLISFMLSRARVLPIGFCAHFQRLVSVVGSQPPQHYMTSSAGKKMCFQRMLHAPAQPPRAAASCSNYKKPHLFVEHRHRFPAGTSLPAVFLSVLRSTRFDMITPSLLSPWPRLFLPCPSRPHTGHARRSAPSKHPSFWLLAQINKQKMTLN